MKQYLKFSLIVLLMVLLAATGWAADPTVTAAAGTPTSSGCEITGTNTCDVTVDGATNALTITLFYGGADGGTTVSSWANAVALTNAFTNGDAWTNTLSGLTPGTVIYYRARAQDLAGTAWSTAAATFTTAASAAFTPDSTFRERLRNGTNANLVVTGNATIATNLTVSGTGTIATLRSTAATVTTLTAPTLNGVTTATITNATITGTGTIGTITPTAISLGGTPYTPTALTLTRKAATTQAALTLSSEAASTQATLTLDTKAASTQVALTSSGIEFTNVVVNLADSSTLSCWVATAATTALTNVTVNTAWAFATDTTVVCTNASLNTVYGFAADTAVVLTNASINTVWGFATTTAGVTTNADAVLQLTP